MKTVYEAANAIEAHMLQDLLRQQGIFTRLDGEFLGGAIGELPAGRLVRLVAEDEQVAAARAAIERWEATQVDEPSAAPAHRPGGRSGRAWTAAALALAVGIGGSWAFFRAPATVDGIDHDRDGVLDERWTYSPAGTLVEARIDRNVDRKADLIQRYDRRGQIASAEADDDFDGTFETRLRYERGNVISGETDTDGDGLPDLLTFYEHGVLKSQDFIDARSGRVLRREHLRLGRVESTELDGDGDGRLDTRLHHDRSGAVTRTQRIDPAAR
ncbi:putative signal transducing protein [Aquabacterium humicola]|uniref:putative signal transducing protein n=1 Tax=Aquabacterium humicola TaxID=3237377 RepID=UPI002543EBF2|nr:DUF2007 domain-containing protein [Rubrivivax pictus]